MNAWAKTWWYEEKARVKSLSKEQKKHKRIGMSLETCKR